MTQDWQEVRDSNSDDRHSLSSLVQNLKDYLGIKSGINSEDIDVEKLKSLIGNYTPSVDEWNQYGKPDPSQNYTRLLIDDINGKCNLVCMFAENLAKDIYSPSL